MLTIDACVSPKGEVASPSTAAPPDSRGTTNRQGKLCKIFYRPCHQQIAGLVRGAARCTSPSINRSILFQLRDLQPAGRTESGAAVPLGDLFRVVPVPVMVVVAQQTQPPGKS